MEFYSGQPDILAASVRDYCTGVLESCLMSSTSGGKTGIADMDKLLNKSKQFSDRLQEAVARYHTNAISTVEVLQELIQIAKDIKTARQRGEEEGPSHDEVAFYAALAENESAVDVMGNDSLKIIAHELLEGLKSNISVDWSRRDSARARMRVLVKRILRRHGYPPDLQDAAIRTVLLQAEALPNNGNRQPNWASTMQKQ